MTTTNEFAVAEPQDVIETYIKHPDNDFARNTRKNKRSNLRAFREWLATKNITDMSVVTPMMIRNRYPVWLDENRNITSKVARNQHYSDIRNFLDHCKKSGYIGEDLVEAVPSPSVDKQSRVRDDDGLAPEFVGRILDRLDRLHYASNRHVALLLMYEVPCRAVTLSALDVGDFVGPEESDRGHGYVEFKHRPDSDPATTLKNGRGSERVVALRDGVCEVVRDYVENKRRDITEDSGRRPLLTSRQGRAKPDGAISSWTRWATRPCFVGDDCTCDGSQRKDLTECQDCDNTGTHPIRKAGISRWRREGVPAEDLAERADMGVELLREVYYQDSEDEKMDRRASQFI